MESIISKKQKIVIIFLSVVTILCFNFSLFFEAPGKINKALVYKNEDKINSLEKETNLTPQQPANSVKNNQITKTPQDINSELKPNKDSKVILAIGDSYTFGLNWKPKFVAHSYSIKMNENFLRHKSTYKVVNKGVNGEISPNTYIRLKEILSIEIFAAVIVLIGINDIGTPYYTADLISENIIKIYDYLKNLDYITVIITVPDVLAFSRSKRLTEKRNKVNENLKKYYQNSKFDKFIFCDIASYFDYSKWTEDDLNKYTYSDLDNIHLSEVGYDFLGECIYNCIKKVFY